MGVAAAQADEHIHRLFGDGVGGGADGERRQHVGEGELDLVFAQHVLFQLDDGREDDGRKEEHVVFDVGERLDGVEHGAGACRHLLVGAAGDEAAVFQLDGDGGAGGGFRLFEGGLDHRALIDGDLVLVHQQADALHRILRAVARLIVAHRLVVAADDLLPGGKAHRLVIDDAVARHVDAHIGGRLVDALVARDLGEDGADDGETLDVSVVVDRHLAVRFKVVRVDHVDVAQVRRGGLVGDVDGVAQGQVPDGEGLKFGVARAHTALIFVVQLRKAGGELAAARPRRRDHDQRFCGLDIRVGAVAFVGDDDVHFRRIAFGLVVDIRLQTVAVEFADEFIGGGLAEVLGDDHAVHLQAEAAQLVDEAQHVGAIRDAEVGADLVALEVCPADDEDDLALLLQGHEDAALGVALKAGEHAAGVHVVKQFAAEFEVQLVVELADAL